MIVIFLFCFVSKFDTHKLLHQRYFISACNNPKLDDLSRVRLEASSELNSSFAIDQIKTKDSLPWISNDVNETSPKEWITFTFNQEELVTGFRFKLHQNFQNGFTSYWFHYGISQDGQETIWNIVSQGQVKHDGSNWTEINLMRYVPFNYIKSKYYRLEIMGDGKKPISIGQLQLKVCSGTHEYKYLSYFSKLLMK